VRAISLWQPWASAIAFGVKRNETRHWATPHRGQIAIHAAKTRIDPRSRQPLSEAFEDILSDSAESRSAFGDHLALEFDVLPFGEIVAVATLVDCVPTLGLEVTLLEESWGNYEPGRFAWKLDQVLRLSVPVPCVGRQGLFDVSLSEAAIANAQLVEAFRL
jgi:hypothetical protein